MQTLIRFYNGASYKQLSREVVFTFVRCDKIVRALFLKKMYVLRENRNENG